jgi:YegS/Rv2252/BmrU family lipid kinase
MPQSDNWFVVINPVSGFGKALKKWDAIRQELIRQQLPFDFEMTTAQHKGDEVLIAAVARGYRRFICVGGDGNLHDMINGVMRQREVPTTDITLGMISLGTGNDWIKTNQVPKDYKQAVAIIKAGKTYVQNAGIARYYVDGKPATRYFHNFAGVGFDSYVITRTIQSKAYGQIAYLLVMLRSLFSYKKPLLRITMDSTVVEAYTYLTLSGIGRYGGGGMKLTPGAQPDGEGLFVSVAKDFSVAEVFRHILKLYDGTFLELEKATSQEHVKKVKIEVLKAEEEVYIEADGDVLGTGPFEVEIINNALRVVIP